MAIEFRKASRKKAKLRLALSAPSGAGKTLGALLLAYGLMKSTHPDSSDEKIWEKIALIDTEEGSGELYVGVEKHRVKIGEFMYNRISAPFTAVKYLDNIHAAEQHGAEIIIIDSLTHAWAGSGGMLDKQGRLTDADPRKNSYTAWRHVTPDHNALVDAMLQSSAHIIGTMRSKTEYVQQTGANGRMQVVKLGMAPVARDGFEYEFTVFFDINDQSVAHATKDRTDLYSSVNASGFLEKREFIITPAVGKELSAWLNTGADRPIVISLESACAAIAQEVAACNDLNVLTALYASHAEIFARLQAERPDWVAAMNGVFETRAGEIATP